MVSFSWGSATVSLWNSLIQQTRKLKIENLYAPQAPAVLVLYSCSRAMSSDVSKCDQVVFECMQKVAEVIISSRVSLHQKQRRDREINSKVREVSRCLVLYVIHVIGSSSSTSSSSSSNSRLITTPHLLAQINPIKHGREIVKGMHGISYGSDKERTSLPLVFALQVRCVSASFYRYFFA